MERIFVSSKTGRIVLGAATGVALLLAVGLLIAWALGDVRFTRTVTYLLVAAAAGGGWWAIGRPIAEIGGDTIRVRSPYGLFHEWRRADLAIEDDPYDVTSFFLVHRPTAKKIRLPRETFAAQRHVDLRERFA